MLGLLPWERLPGWLLGPLMMVVGTWPALNEQPYSWRQFAAIVFTIWGVGVLIHWVKKPRVERETDAPSEE
jgi:hypothetical protein